MGYVSLYRKYRSQSFRDLIGQDHVVRTLQNAIASGRIAHAYLFTGPRGTGKTSTARLLAKALCCENGPNAEPCNECSICREITAGACTDVYEMDAASESGVDQVRERIVEASEYLPNVARYKVFIIDEVHDLSPKAFDALLKTIEEPPPHIIFILATTEYIKVPPTIRSRCQKHEFHRASMSDLVGRLEHVAQAEGIPAEPAALTAIARMADGGYRDALTLLEQAMITQIGTITLQQVYDQLGLLLDEWVDGLLLSLREGKPDEVIRRLDEVSRQGRDPRAVLDSLMFRLADLTRAAYQIEDGGSGEAAREAALHETAARMGRERLTRLRSLVADAHRTIRDISLPRLWLEAELCRIATVLDEVPAAAPVAKAAPAPAAAAAKTSQAAAPVAAKSTPEPKPEPVKAKPEPKPAASGPVGDEPEAVWARMLEHIPESTPIAMRLNGAQVIGKSGDALQIGLSRKMDVEWVQDDPRRMKYLLDILHNKVGKPWKVSFTHQAANGPAAEPAAVELPAEGDRLDQMARSVFESG